jgi:GTP1/Obg family GTP-binding protein
MFSIYGNDQLPYINTNASGRAIAEWKNSDEVKKCYEKLHTYMEKIIEKVCGIDPQRRSLAQVAFTKASVKMMLNPRTDKIRFSETLMKRKVEQYMVC